MRAVRTQACGRGLGPARPDWPGRGVREDQTPSRVGTWASLSSAVKLACSRPLWVGRPGPIRASVATGSPRPVTLPLWEPELVSLPSSFASSESPSETSLLRPGSVLVTS